MLIVFSVIYAITVVVGLNMRRFLSVPLIAWFIPVVNTGMLLIIMIIGLALSAKPKTIFFVVASLSSIAVAFFL